MNNPRLKVTVAVALAVVLGLPSMGFAWWGFVHYRVAKDIVGVDPNYAMGPDTFKATDDIIIPLSISPEFTWSHAVMASDLDAPPPDIPQYPHDGRYPGKAMYDLVTKKLSPTTVTSMQGPNAYQQSPIETSKGFLVHNASDNIVHWSYFLGGDTPLACSLFPGWMWETNHKFKEEWASYIVLMLKDARTNGGAGTPIELFQYPGEDNMMGTSDDIFSSLTEDANLNGQLDAGEDQDGNGVLTDYTDDVFGPPEADGFRRLQPYLRTLNPISFKTNAKLINLAMKAYRKNRRNTDINGAVGSGTESIDIAFSVKSTAEVISSFSSEILSGNAAMNELTNMSLMRFHELNMAASTVNAAGFTSCGIQRWHPADVMSRYNQSVVRGAAWLANAGN